MYVWRYPVLKTSKGQNRIWNNVLQMPQSKQLFSTFFGAYVTLLCFDWIRCKRCLNPHGALWKSIQHSWIIYRADTLPRNQYTNVFTSWQIIKIYIYQLSPQQHMRTNTDFFKNKCILKDSLTAVLNIL